MRGNLPRRYGHSVILRVYPRACGGTQQRPTNTGGRTSRSIPARAGEPQPPGHRLLTDCQGLSPRVRGNPPIPRNRFPGKQQVYPRACGGTAGIRLGNTGRPGSIPARAGEPPQMPIRKPCLAIAVYPRACGGTPGVAASADGDGSIPARAPRRRLRFLRRSLSPRVRGNLAIAGVLNACIGLSPRVRGNRTQEVAVMFQLSLRSIPARAGEPPCSVGVGYAGLRVYPRACGGTIGLGACAGIVLYGTGLSPRVRGNPGISAIGPAWAARVYPRACGGTCNRCVNALSCRGLSPRVRGNLAGMYSRTLGLIDDGLSPRVRGNPR